MAAEIRKERLVDTCPNCHLGLLKQIRAVYVQIYGDTLIHVPDTLAWKCDVCGETYFDPEAVHRMDILIGDSGPPPNRHVSPPPETTPADPDRPVTSHLPPRAK
jgi:YgiT-type zinc finger domain-containing protein